MLAALTRRKHDRRLGLLVPGLFASATLRQQCLGGGTCFDQLGLLETLLSRAQPLCLHASGWMATLFELCGYPPQVEERLPVAPFTLYADQGEAPAGYWLRADPVHLQADLDCVRMMGGQDLQLTAAEQALLDGELNACLQAYDMQLLTPSASRWYLRLHNVPAIQTTPPKLIIGENIHAHMPRGEGARFWRKLLNEIQMLLHASRVNEQRLAAGLPPVSSLWFWGGGVLPEATTTSWDVIVGDEALGAGLARHLGARWTPLPADAREWLAQDAAEDRQLLVWTGLLDAVQQDDPDSWCRGLETFQQHWLAPVWQALRTGRLAELTLYPATGSAYHITPQQLRRWWRRRRPLQRFLADCDHVS